MGDRRLFYDWVPHICYASQPGLRPCVRKHAVMGRGLPDCAAVRPSTLGVDEPTRDELYDILSCVPQGPTT